MDAKQYLKQEYGEEHLKMVMELNDEDSIIALMNEFAEFKSNITEDDYGTKGVAQEGENQCELCKYYTEPRGCGACCFCMKNNKPEEYYL